MLCGEMVMGLQLLRALVQQGMWCSWPALGFAPRWWGEQLVEKLNMVAKRLGCNPTEVELFGRLVMKGVELEWQGADVVVDAEEPKSVVVMVKVLPAELGLGQDMPEHVVLEQ